METTPRATQTATDRGARPAEAGFTILEVLVSLSIMVVVLLGLLTLVDFSGRVAKAQVTLSEMQQSLRVAQTDVMRQVRMSGRGGLPQWHEPIVGTYDGMQLPKGPAVAVTNDVAAGVNLADHPGAPIRPGTDVLTVRGVINNVLYQVNWDTDGDVSTARAAEGGQVTVRDETPAGIPQDLQPLRDALTGCDGNPCPEALILAAPGSGQVFAVAELSGGSDNGDHVVLQFRLSGGSHYENYRQLSPGGEFPVGLKAVAMVGLVEEYRYYIRDVEPAPRLARARFYPNTDAPYGGDTDNVVVDLADNILDLQVALGIDRNNDERVVETDDASDEWLYNQPGDTPETLANWNSDIHRLYYVRINTLARSDRLDREHVSPPIDAIEDRDYSESAVPSSAELLERRYRRRLLRTVVDLRNLS